MAMNSRNTQTSRWATYGLNVTVAAVIAIAVVVVVNMMAFRFYKRVDLTATRQYSLSKQTQLVLDELQEDYRVVTLLRQSDPYLQRVHDLVEDYARASGRLAIEHIESDRELTRLDNFYASLTKIYANDLEPLQAAIANGREALDTFRTNTTRQTEVVGQLLENNPPSDEQLHEFLRQIGSVLARIKSNIDEFDAQITSNLDGSLPDYAGASALVGEQLRQYDQRVLAPAVQQLEQSLKTATLSSETQTGLENILGSLRESRSNLRTASRAIDDAPAAESYATVMRQLATNPNCVVIISSDGVEVLGTNQLFRATPSGPNVPDDVEQVEPVFLGEEMLTGTLIKMSLEHPPLVVFVTASRRPTLGRDGLYNELARRMGQIGFQVESWSPLGTMGPMGQPIPAGPLPQASEGQKLVWVIAPVEPPNQRDPMSVQGYQQVQQMVQERMNAGDAMLISLMASPGNVFGKVDPIMQTLETYGVSVALETVMMHEIQDRSRQSLASTQYMVTQWPEESPITGALQGLSGFITFGSPITLRPIEGRDDIKYHRLVELNDPNMWAESEMKGFPHIKPNEETRTNNSLVGVAVETKDNRLIVVADPVWATDDALRIGQLGPNTADITGAVFPANAELFVNSVYWLSGLDQLIGASARSQDLRRVSAIPKGTLSTLRWSFTFGLPALIVASGILVYFVRQRA